MFLQQIYRGLRFTAILTSLELAAIAQLPIDGIADKGFYNNSVTYRVQAQAGYTYAAWLNGKPAAIGVFTTITRPDFYQLYVQRTETATSLVTNRLVRFLVNASDRAGTEWGLPPHTPWPIIQSASNEFAGSHLRIVAPQDFPAGYEIPIVAWVENNDTHAVRANGLLAAPGHPSIQIRRGVGSGFLSSNAPAGPLNYAAAVCGLATNKTINIESSPSWTTVSGILGNATWPVGSRVHVTGNLTVPAGTTLTIEAGTIVRLNGGLDITNNGQIVINGTTERPVVFMPDARSQPWGGFVQHANNSRLTATGAIFTGSGAVLNCWFKGHECSTSLSGISSHRGEQALISLKGANCNLSLTDCAAIDLAGQFGHSEGSGGNSYAINLTHFLMQRCTTGGEYTGANFTVNDSAFIECPDDTPSFVDGDNDALYLVSGTHNFTNTLVGWTKDDGIDSGGDGVGTLTYQSCWFEATFHEGNSLSGAKTVRSRDTVYLNCGQGLEDGYGGSGVIANHCLFLANQVGLRHGDNYNTYTYTGTIAATNSILLNNHHDVFAYNWRTNGGGGFTNAWSLCFASNNFLTTIDTNFPNNSVWNPSTDAWRLAAFSTSSRVGVALATRTGQTNFPDGVPVVLSVFCTNAVTVDYAIQTAAGATSGGTLTFAPGEMQQFLPPLPAFLGLLRITLSNPQNADLTGTSRFYVQQFPAVPARVQLGRFGSEAAAYWGDPSFRLQQSSEVSSTNWATLPGSSPVPVNPSDPRQFYRLIK